MNRLFLVVTLCLTGLISYCLRAQSIKAVMADTTPVVVRKTTKLITPDTYAGRQLAVGSGGGVRGISTTYYLLDDGRLFGRRSRDTSFTFIAKQTAPITKRVFTSVEESCKIKTTKFDHPGNIYKFVRWRKGKQAHIVTWGEPGKTVPPNYPKMYDAFMAMIPISLRLK